MMRNSMTRKEKLTIINGGFLVLLVFRYQIIHVGFSFCEFHLVHALTSVPMEESLSSEHSSELLGNSLEKLLDGCGVSDKGGCHLKTSGWNITYSSLNIVGDPFDKV